MSYIGFISSQEIQWPPGLSRFFVLLVLSPQIHYYLVWYIFAN